MDVRCKVIQAKWHSVGLAAGKSSPTSLGQSRSSEHLTNPLTWIRSRRMAEAADAQVSAASALMA
jgi:hypothetical protein